jgi:hypothetical protein
MKSPRKAVGKTALFSAATIKFSESVKRARRAGGRIEGKEKREIIELARSVKLEIEKMMGQEADDVIVGDHEYSQEFPEQEQEQQGQGQGLGEFGEAIQLDDSIFEADPEYTADFESLLVTV